MVSVNLIRYCIVDFSNFGTVRNDGGNAEIVILIDGRFYKTTMPLRR